jgi:hypothetical protein
VDDHYGVLAEVERLNPSSRRSEPSVVLCY